MNYLSLFSGVGGGDIAMQHLVGMTCKGYVEYDEYCQKTISQRIKDGLFDNAPIFGDIRAFIGQGYAESYSGMVDCITAGFPCQPFSVAGKQLAAGDHRNMWPETATVISIVRPAHIMLENVPGIKRYLPVVVRDLRGIGYTVRRPAVVAAASLGAGHIRRRVWIYAHSDKAGQPDAPWKPASSSGESKRDSIGVGNRTEISTDRDAARELQPQGFIENVRRRSCDHGWWAAEPGVVRVAYGVPNGMDRLAALGNAQVPAVAATAWRLLSDG